jgi:hypothetical protein
MSLTRDDFRRLLDIEATVDDGDEDEDEDSDEEDHGTFAEISYYLAYSYQSGDFIEDEAILETQSTPWRHLTNTDENLGEGGWGDLLASLEKRYGSDNRIAEGAHRHERLIESHPIASSIDNIIWQLPRTDDYPLWRIRCKVTPSRLILRHILHIICLARLRRRDRVSTTSDGCGAP